MTTASTGAQTAATTLTGNTVTDALLNGVHWASNSITYSFIGPASTWASNYSDPSYIQSTQGFSTAQQVAAGSALYGWGLGAWGNVANLLFFNVSDDASSDGIIRLGFSSSHSWSGPGSSYSPGNTNPSGGDVWLNPAATDSGGSASGTFGNSSFALGSYSYFTLLKYEGWALGLKIPSISSTNGGGGSLTGTTSSSWDSQIYSVMSFTPDQAHTDATGFSFYPTTPMLLDIQAIQAVYGANSTYHAGDTVYSFNDNPGQYYFQTIWDSGGNNTIAYTGSTNSTIDLNQGHGSYIGNPVSEYTATSKTYRVQNVWIAYGTNIQNADLSGSSAANTVIGNDLGDTITLGSGHNSVTCGTGNDTIICGMGNYVDGGAGTDTVVFPNAAANYSVQSAGGGFMVTDKSGAGSTTVKNVEYLKFASTNWATVDASTNINIDLSSSSANNWVIGNNLGDTIVLGSGSSQVTCGTGNDTIICGKGASSIDGGAGTDTVVFQGNVTAYTVNKTTSGYNVIDQSGFYGTVTLSNVEYLKFVSTSWLLVDMSSSLSLDLGASVVNDWIFGNDLGDTIILGSGNNRVTCGAGNDTITCGKGSNTIDGGGGVDTVIFQGVQANFSISHSASAYIVTDKTGVYGTTTLFNIEYLQFSDAKLDLTTPLPSYVLSASAPTVNEGSSVTYTVTTTNVAAGTVLNYTLSGSGITTADVSGGSLTGSATVDANGTATFTVGLVADKLTEGPETMVATLSSATATSLATATVVVNDTSISVAPTRVFLGSGNTFTVADNNDRVTGASGPHTDTVRIQSGVTGTQMDANVERVELAGNLASYKFIAIAGAGAEVEDASGAVVATIPSLNQNATIAFADGSATLMQTGASSFTLGGQAIGNAVAGGFASSALSGFNPADISTLGNSSGVGPATTRVFIGSGNTFTADDNNLSIAGASGTGTETVRIQTGVAGTKTDANIERIELAGNLANFKFATLAGAGAEIEDASGVVIATVPSLNQNATVAFADGSAPLAQTGASSFSLEGQTISSATASGFTASSQAGFNATDKSTLGNLATTGSIAVAAAGTASAAGGDFTFHLAAGTYNYSINGFGVGDKIVGPAGATISVSNPSGTDGSVALQFANAAQTVSVTLTGLTSAQDAGISDAASFNTVFGTGALA